MFPSSSSSSSEGWLSRHALEKSRREQWNVQRHTPHRQGAQAEVILCTFTTGCKKGKDTRKRTQFPVKSASTKHRNNRLEELDSTSRKTSFCSRTDVRCSFPRQIKVWDLHYKKM
uniref:Uncharacterized protein n=1 Tax=Caenorhabditis japonica TaxID=281687 RepID=A0A8R1E6M4_CAEJA